MIVISTLYLLHFIWGEHSNACMFICLRRFALPGSFFSEFPVKKILVFLSGSGKIINCKIGWNLRYLYHTYNDNVSKNCRQIKKKSNISCLLTSFISFTFYQDTPNEPTNWVTFQLFTKKKFIDLISNMMNVNENIHCNLCSLYAQLQYYNKLYISTVHANIVSFHKINKGNI